MSRQQGYNLDELLITAYAPQATDDLQQRNAFFLAILEMMQAVPRRTRIWLLGDFNGHVGSDLRSAAVGRHTAGNTNNNGFSLVHACEQLGAEQHLFPAVATLGGHQMAKPRTVLTSSPSLQIAGPE